jgi:glycosyltransferase involved in cell wall biosynthesis
MLQQFVNVPPINSAIVTEIVTKPIVSIILPAYNEAQALPRLLYSLYQVIDNRYEVLVVDDGSRDNTVEIASRFSCRLVSHEVNKGKGAAVRTGLRSAQGDYVIVMDADNTYPAQALPQMVEMLRTHDLVRCTRQMNSESMPLVNWIGNIAFDSMLTVIYGMKGGDYMTGLYGLRREALEAMQFTSEGFDLEVEIGIKAQANRLKVITFPVAYQERLGEKKLRPFADGWRIMRRILKMALLYNPLLSFILPGILVMALTVAMLLALGANPFTGDISVHKLFLTMLGSSTGFELAIFGICASLYGHSYGIPAHPWLLYLAKPIVRRVALVVGAFLLAGSSLTLFSLFLTWLISGNASGIQTYQLLQAGMFFFWGMQLVIATLFVSIFADKAFNSKRSRSFLVS